MPDTLGVEIKMSTSDSDKRSIPLAARHLPEIPPMRRDGESLSQTISQGNRMSVGPGIDLKGEISNCAILVVEGNVEATLDAESLEVLQRGVFKGEARVETADIQGTVEGVLSVTGLLRVHSTGSASGKITYGRIEVDTGGGLHGEINQIEEENTSAQLKIKKEAVDGK